MNGVTNITLVNMSNNLRQIKIFRNYYGLLTNYPIKIRLISFPRVRTIQNEYIHSIAVQNHLHLVPFHPNSDCVRFKSKSKNKAKSAEESDDEFSDDEETFKEGEYDPDGGKVKKLTVRATRVDQILKAGFGLSRRKVEESLLSNKLKLNGGAIPKKSYEVSTGDEFELFADSTDGDVSNKSIAKIVVKKIEPSQELSLYYVYVTHHKY